MSLLVVTAGATFAQADPQSRAEAALAEAQRQGFSDMEEFRWHCGRACWFPTPGAQSTGGAALRKGERWAAYAGSVYWKGCTGTALLERLLANDAPPNDVAWDEFVGSFALVLSNASGVWMLNDALGLQKIYRTGDGDIASSSFMVCRATLQKVEVDRERAQEYVLFGANHGSQTPVRNICIADPTLARRLDHDAEHRIHAPQRLRRPCAFGSPQEAASSLSSIVADSFADMLRAFGPDIGMALSGGFDSRLILAALDRLGVRPHLYVYGSPGDADVVIARVIAEAIGLPIECIDKRDLDRGMAPPTVHTLRESLAFFDGLPVDGAIDLGSDRSTRLDQLRGGRLNLNGGGGEILRNFYYLPDRTFSAADLVDTFYSNWRREVFPTEADRLRFTTMMADGILESLGREQGNHAARSARLSRADVELTYTLFRLRYWMGRNNSIATRFGDFLTPLVQPALVALCASIPVGWKNHGQLESAIIRELSPRVAQGPSAYGFDFSAGPSLTHRLRAAASLHRPLGVRRRSAEIQHLLGRTKPAATPALWQEATASLATPDWINMSALTGVDQINRVYTVQAILSNSPAASLASEDAGQHAR
jgi:hypothetical protein